LEGGPPCFPRDFSCPAVLTLSPRRPAAFAYAPLTLCGGPFQALRLAVGFLTSAVRCPRTLGGRSTPDWHRAGSPLSQHRFGLIPVRSPLLGDSRLFSLPRGTEMFQFPRLPARVRLCSRADGVSPPPGCPIRAPADQRLVDGSPRLIAAFLRPSSALGAQASTSRPDLASHAPACALFFASVPPLRRTPMREKTSSLVQTPDPRRWTAVLDISVSRHDSRGAASPEHLLPGTRSASRVRVVLPRVFVQLLTTTRSASPPGTPRHDPLVPVVCPASPPDPLRPGHRAPASLGPRGQPTKKPPPGGAVPIARSPRASPRVTPRFLHATT
jgi:hypothetical protein